jgi:hypothetical protein
LPVRLGDQKDAGPTSTSAAAPVGSP